MSFKTTRAADQYATLCPELKTLVDDALAQKEYRTYYNNRDEVKARRRAYNKVRTAKIRQALDLLEAQNQTEVDEAEVVEVVEADEVDEG